MSTLAREELLWRFGKAEDPEIEARRQRILDVLLEASPQKKQQLIDTGIEKGIGGTFSDESVRELFLQLEAEVHF